MVYRIRHSQKPTYFYNKFAEPFTRETRLASNGRIRENQTIKSDVGLSNFSHMATKMWNNLPASIRVQNKMEKFKIEAKEWIKTNVNH